MLPAYFVIIGTLIGAIGSVAYLIDTVKGKIKPNRVSFLLWSIAPFIAFAAQIQQHVGIASLMTFSVGFLPIIIFCATYVNKKAVWNLSKFDLICGALSIIGLLLWLLTKQGNVAILFSILADLLAAIPTVVKAYKYPDTEAAWPWIATSIGVIVTLFTIKTWTFANSSFIIYICFINCIIFGLVRFRIGEKLGFENK